MKAAPEVAEEMASVGFADVRVEPSVGRWFVHGRQPWRETRLRPMPNVSASDHETASTIRPVIGNLRRSSVR